MNLQIKQFNNIEPDGLRSPDHFCRLRSVQEGMLVTSQCPFFCLTEGRGIMTNIHDVAVTSLINAYGESETDAKFIRAACTAIYNHGVGVGIRQGIQAGKEAGLASESGLT